MRAGKDRDRRGVCVEDGCDSVSLALSFFLTGTKGNEGTECPAGAPTSRYLAP